MQSCFLASVAALTYYFLFPGAFRPLLAIKTCMHQVVNSIMYRYRVWPKNLHCHKECNIEIAAHMYTYERPVTSNNNNNNNNNESLLSQGMQRCHKVVVFFPKMQPYIPSRKAVYVVEHVEKELSMWGKKKAFKAKKKNCQHLDSNLDHQKCRESVKGRQSHTV